MEQVWHELNPKRGDVGGSGNIEGLEEFKAPASMQEKQLLIGDHGGRSYPDQFMGALERFTQPEQNDLLRSSSERPIDPILQKSRTARIGTKININYSQVNKTETTLQEVIERMQGSLGKPYEDCVEQLKRITMCSTPFDKLACI